MDSKIKVKGCLAQKKGRYYATVYYTIEGTRKFETRATGITVSSHKKKVANEILENFIREKQQEIDNLVQQALDNKLKHSFADCFERWIIEKRKVVDVNTAASYVEKTKGLIAYFREKGTYIEDLKTKDLNEYYAKALESGRSKPDKDGNKGLSNRTVGEQASLVKAFLKDAVGHEIINKNPAEDVKIYYVKESNIKKINFMDYEQTKALLEYVKNEPRFEVFYEIIMLCVYYGLRRSELLGLRWNALDFEKDIIEIKHTAVRVNSETVYKDDVKCGDSHRFMPIIEETRDIFLRLKEKQEKLGIYSDEQFVIVWDDGRPYKPDYLSKRFKILIEVCPIKEISKDLSFHGLRHTADAILFEQGWSIAEVQQWLGHKDINTTANIYNHVTVKWKNLHGNKIRPFFESSNRVPTES